MEYLPFAYKLIFAPIKKKQFLRRQMSNKMIRRQLLRLVLTKREETNVLPIKYHKVPSF